MIIKLTIVVIVLVWISNSNGDDIAKRLQARYKSVKKCYSRGQAKPAYQCSGIMIRGVGGGVPWDMKALNQQKDSFSLAYLRSDQKFSSVAGYNSGFIIYPHLKAPKKKNTYKVYCSFPFNAATDARTGHGCGKFPNDPNSNHCNRLKIKSFNAWKTYFHANMQSVASSHCAFDISRRKTAAKYFDLTLQANRYIQKHLPNYALKHNELKMHAWNVKNVNKIPIETFFYVLDTPGKDVAEKFQDEFYARGGGEVPIVGIRLPTATTSFKVINHKRKPKKKLT